MGLDHHLGSFPRLWAANTLPGIAHQSHSLRSVSEDPHWPVQCFQQPSKPSVGAMNREHTLDGRKMHFPCSTDQQAVPGGDLQDWQHCTKPGSPTTCQPGENVLAKSVRGSGRGLTSQWMGSNFSTKESCSAGRKVTHALWNLGAKLVSLLNVYLSHLFISEYLGGREGEGRLPTKSSTSPEC